MRPSARCPVLYLRYKFSFVLEISPPGLNMHLQPKYVQFRTVHLTS